MFRVRAANKAGVGKPSDPTDPVTAETRPGLLILLDENKSLNIY